MTESFQNATVYFQINPATWWVKTDGRWREVSEETAAAIMGAPDLSGRQLQNLLWSDHIVEMPNGPAQPVWVGARPPGNHQ